MPPNQWVRQRQASRLLENSSNERTVVTPVVVNPETLSKTESINPIPLNRYGNAPKKQTSIQPQPTIAIASRMRNLYVVFLIP